MSESTTRSMMGRTRFGRYRLPTLTVAVPFGVLIAVVGGLLVYLAGISGVNSAVGVTGVNPIVGGAVFAFAFAGPAIALIYVLVVDRDTISGTVGRPEETVESGWYTKASSGAFTDVLLFTGLAVAILSFAPVSAAIRPNTVLLAVIIIAFASFAVRFLLLKRKG